MVTLMNCQIQKKFLGTTQPLKQAPLVQKAGRQNLQVCNSLKDLRDRIGSVQNTFKITEAMKLVAAAKVRRAQEAVINGRPFSENLVKVLFGVNQRLRLEDVDSPLATVRAVKKVLVVIVTGDRGLCGAYNNAVIRQGEGRVKELLKLGIQASIVTVGSKGAKYFNKRKDTYNIDANFRVGQRPTSREAQAIADRIFADFVSENVDKVELVYTKFISLVNSTPIVQTLLPLTPRGEICDLNGNCVDAEEDEVFRLTSKEGKFEVEREKVTTDTSMFDDTLLFEQEPVQILDALLPLYLNSQLLRALQEALASELASRMNAMSSACDNAGELKKNLTQKYNKGRQARITAEILEIVSGAEALQ